jgi:enterochelin esterase family protein
VRNLRSLLTTQNYPYDYLEVNEGHSWGNWRARVGRILTRFFPLESAGAQGEPEGAAPAPTLKVMPMPLGAKQQFLLTTSMRGNLHLRLIDITGRSFDLGQHMSDGQTSLTVQVPAEAVNGMYTLTVSTDSAHASVPLVITP